MLGHLPPPAPRPRLRAPIRWPCWAWRGWPRPGWHRRALPRPACRRRWPLRTLLRQWAWRVAGKPCQHRSDRLGLLPRKEAASLTAQQLHLVGEPWRPRSWPSTTVAALAAAAAGSRAGGVGQGSGLGMYGSLLARRRRLAPLAAFHGRVPRLGSVAPDPDRVSITPIGASARSPAPTPTSVPSRRRSSAKAARRGGVERAAPRRPREPRVDRGRAAWLARVAQRNWAAHARRNRPAPARWRRSGSITRRSPTVQAVSGSFIRRSPATRWRRRG
jgi:hypothetical protein